MRYFIGEVLSAPNDSLIIIDEPENHLHKSILVRLWDAIEKERTNCSFLYITHDLEFALSRFDSQVIWVKAMPKINEWEYKLVDGETDIDPLKLEIIGSRQQVLIVEGNKTHSYDRKVYTALFPEYNVLPVGSCSKVIELTKALNLEDSLHYCEVKGIIDRDRRDEHEIGELKKHNIYCLEVAEVENLFLLPDVIRCVCLEQHLAEKSEEIIDKAKEKVFEYLQKNIDSQAMLFTISEINNRIIEAINKKVDNIEEYKKSVAIDYNKDIDEYYNKIRQQLKDIVNNKDYIKALMLINCKRLVESTQISNYFQWKTGAYIDFIMRCLKSDDDLAEQMKRAMQKYINIEAAEED